LGDRRAESARTRRGALSRAPVVVVSPYARAHSVTNVVHDHTPVLAAIAQQSNRPALTYRDANATTLADFLDVARIFFPEPPSLAAPANPLPGLVAGCQGQPVPPAPLHRSFGFLKARWVRSAKPGTVHHLFASGSRRFAVSSHLLWIWRVRCVTLVSGKSSA
jgi:hypothetical protein